MPWQSVLYMNRFFIIVRMFYNRLLHGVYTEPVEVIVMT